MCKVKECISDLAIIMKYVKDNWNEVSLFENSIGACFSLLTYQNEEIKTALFLSSVVNMQRIIKNMISCFDVPEERLLKEQSIV